MLRVTTWCIVPFCFITSKILNSAKRAIYLTKDVCHIFCDTSILKMFSSDGKYLKRYARVNLKLEGLKSVKLNTPLPKLVINLSTGSMVVTYR